MSATVVRELVARLGLQVDQQSFDKADKDLTEIKTDLQGIDKGMRDASGRFIAGSRRMAQGADQAAARIDKARQKQERSGGMGETFGKLLGGLAVGGAISNLLELASSAQETDSLLGVVFGDEAAGRVRTWSETTATALGRSRYALQESAGAFGGLLQAAKQSQDATAGMSEQLAVLAIDLASMYNTTEEEAVQAIKSGIVGQSEPLLKYVINVQEAQLVEEAHAQGLKKKVSQMTNAEKTMLRYNAILRQGKIAEGDAIRMGKGYANQMRALQARVRDLATAFGSELLPYVTRVVGWGIQLSDWFTKAAKNSNLFKGAMVALGIVLYSVFGPFLLSAAGIIAAFAAIALIVDDVITMFEKGDSVIGSFIDSLFGLGAADALVDNAVAAFGVLRGYWDQLQQSISEVDWAKKFSQMQADLRAFGIVLTEWFEKAYPWIEKVVGVLGKLVGVLGELAVKAAEGFSGFWDRYATDSLENDPEEQERRRKMRESRDARAARSAARVGAPGPTGSSPILSSGPPTSAAPGVLVPLPGAAGATARPVINLNQGGVYINVPPGTSPDEAARAAAKTARLERLRTQYALRVTTGRRYA